MKVSPDFLDSNSDFFPVCQNCFRKVYQLQTDLEEAKGDEFLKLHDSLQAIHAIVDETYALLTKERESAQKAIEEGADFVQETAPIHVKDTEKIDKLSAEVEDLTSRLELEKRVKIDLEEAKGQEILKLQNSLKAMETKVDETNALLTKEHESSHKKIDKLSAELEELKKKLLESERKRPNESEKKYTEAVETSEIKQQKLKETVNADVDETPQKSLNEKQQEYQDLLIRCIALDLGFSKGRPVAACIIYKCLKQWRSFEAEKTDIFNRVLETICYAIKMQDTNNVLAYWLSNSSMLLLLMHCVEPKRYTASIFNQRLKEYVVKIYGMIRDNLKKEISPLVNLNIQDIHIGPWHVIVHKCDNFLKMLKSENVPPFLVRKIFTQIFSFINAQLFNSVLATRECCTFRIGEHMKAGLSVLEHWYYNATEEYVGSAWDELKHIRQAIGFLVIHEKPKKMLDEISHDLCPDLSIQQLYRISTRFWDEKYGTHSLSPDVITKMKVLMTQNSNNAVSLPFLLGDDSRSFSVDDLFKSMGQIDIADVEPPLLIRGNPGFGFLME